MREWVHGIRSGANSLAAIDIGLPVPFPTFNLKISQTMRQQRQQQQQRQEERGALDKFLRPDYPMKARNDPSSPMGLFAHVSSLCPMTESSPMWPTR